MYKDHSMPHKLQLTFLLNPPPHILFFSFLFENAVLLLSSKIFILSGMSLYEADTTLCKKKKYPSSLNSERKIWQINPHTFSFII